MNTIIMEIVVICLFIYYLSLSTLILESVEQAQAGVYFEVNALLSEVRIIRTTVDEFRIWH